MYEAGLKRRNGNERQSEVYREVMESQNDKEGRLKREQLMLTKGRHILCGAIANAEAGVAENMFSELGA